MKIKCKKKASHSQMKENIDFHCLFTSVKCHDTKGSASEGIFPIVEMKSS